ncbi:hypothetical protein ASPSYDRAFT_1018639 [Aspergillus sydowii CBS 593.65]|uniref:Uncharacterized protein n=1 Tax=Aspergillus sydowii CBS 593.65 TaxID=1036612 RepID=A0A1L9TEV6_9EURO|nr:uncharacterized protein ASPSYDRAFT_1018639 [Aspergillus sydowii CBS 593.65]OJJ57960.1 hypothetical protein ASPSYDRAFT_1018639 [Aspergillus sydowii CBS 593.65]
MSTPDRRASAELKAKFRQIYGDLLRHAILNSSEKFNLQDKTVASSTSKAANHDAADGSQRAASVPTQATCNSAGVQQDWRPSSAPGLREPMSSQARDCQFPRLTHPTLARTFSNTDATGLPGSAARPVCCIYFRPYKTDATLSKNDYYYAVYLRQRTVNDLVHGICRKSMVDC